MVIPSLAVFCSGCYIDEYYSTHDFHISLVGGYELWRTSSDNCVISGKDGNGVLVPNAVYLVGVQGDVITAKQLPKPVPNTAGEGGAGGLGHDPVDDEFRYWIIYAHEARVQGPLTKAEYLDACKKLGVAPDDLKPVDYYGQRAYETATASKR